MARVGNRQRLGHIGLPTDSRGDGQAERTQTERAERQAIAECHAPILVHWPEIDPEAHADDSLRRQYVRRHQRSATQPASSSHVTRDFHPRDVRLILDHAQAWEPRPPLPLVPVGFVRLYRDFARFFFWPLAGAVVFTMLAVALAQGAPNAARLGIEIGALVLLGGLYLVMLRSPILTPVDYWHHLNHIVVGAGLVVIWVITFGTGSLLWLTPAIVVPSALLVLTSLVIQAASGFSGIVLAPIHWLRALLLWMLNRRAHSPPPRLPRSPVIQGIKPPHEYTEDGELFFRHPRDGKPIHRADRPAFWSAYARVLARSDHRYPVTYYARVLDSEADGTRVVQYWLCYYYNDWANEHETDWESVMVVLKNGEPVAAACSAHEGGEWRDWQHVEQRDGRPVFYVAAGSHALYFSPGAYLTERAVAGLRVTSVDAAFFGKEIMDYVDFTPGEADEHVVLGEAAIVLIPDPRPDTGRWGHDDHGDPACRGNCAHNLEWLNYEGHWGSVGVSLAGGFSGPRGPTSSGLPWDNPSMWASTMCRPCGVCGRREGHVRDA